MLFGYVKDDSRRSEKELFYYSMSSVFSISCKICGFEDLPY